jgi:hypothetical protein
MGPQSGRIRDAKLRQKPVGKREAEVQADDQRVAVGQPQEVVGYGGSVAAGFEAHQPAGLGRFGQPQPSLGLQTVA